MNYELLGRLDKNAIVKAIIVTVVVVLLVYLGSRNFRNFDAALIPYLLGILFAVFGITYRFSVWLQRPPTKMYWQRMGKQFAAHPGSFIRLFFRNLVFQKIIYPRGKNRWV